MRISAKSVEGNQEYPEYVPNGQYPYPVYAEMEDENAPTYYGPDTPQHEEVS